MSFRVFVALVVLLLEIRHIHGDGALGGMEFGDDVLHENGFGAHVADQAERIDVLVAPTINDQARAALPAETQIEELRVNDPDNQ